MPHTIADLLAKQQMLVVGHRGAAAVAPENTRASLAAGLAAGADLVELDYHHTADGVPVVLHDKTLDRTTDARAHWRREEITVVSTPLAELKRLDAGGWFSAEFAGEAIPTLEEALRLICETSCAAIEHKQGDAATCVELLRRLNVLDRVAVMSFDWEFLTAAHRLCDELVLVALGDQQLLPTAENQIAQTGARVVGWNQKFIERSQIDQIHAGGRGAWVYTVNEPDRARRLAADRIDAIISDDPAAIRDALFGS